MTNNVIETDEDVLDEVLSLPKNQVTKDIKDRNILKAEEAEKDFDAAYKFTDTKLKELIGVGMDAVHAAALVASQTGDYKHIEALSSLIKSVGELTKGVVESAKIKSDINKDSYEGGSQPAETSVVNNTIFVGAIEDVLRQLDDIKKVKEVPAAKNGITIENVKKTT